MPVETQPNGILPLILGHVVGAGAKQLPPAGPEQASELSIEIDAGQPYQMVRIRYKLMRHKRGKNIHWFWTAIHAERAE